MVAGHEAELRLGTLYPHGPTQIKTINARHIHVRKQQVNRTAMGSGNRERLLAIACGKNRMPFSPQQGKEHVSQPNIIFGKQDHHKNTVNFRETVTGVVGPYPGGKRLR
jgi:hypothetical protein